MDRVGVGGGNGGPGFERVAVYVAYEIWVVHQNPRRPERCVSVVWAFDRFLANRAIDKGYLYRLASFTE